MAVSFSVTISQCLMFDRRRDPGFRNETNYLSAECPSLECHLPGPLVRVEDKRRRIVGRNKEISNCKSPQAVSAGRHPQPAQPPYISAPSPAEDRRPGLLETEYNPERQPHVTSSKDVEDSGISEYICQSTLCDSYLVGR